MKNVVHALGIGLWPIQCFDSCPLRDVRRTRFGVSNPVGKKRSEFFIGSKAQTPASHRPSFGTTIGDDGALLHAG